MKKILLKNKKILVVIAAIIIIPLIYFFLFYGKKISYSCAGKSFNGSDNYEFWIFDTKKNLVYQRSLAAVPLPFDDYPDMYRFSKNSETLSLEHTFYKASELLTIRARTKINSGYDRTITYKCQKKS
jgi:hypothetical protein